jgi:type IV pilus biogenesis protein CpaD/CtpE
MMQRSLTGLPRASVLLLAATLLLSGCASLEPWVKPYEREHLADPIMSLSPNPVSATYLDHVYESREGSKGATGAVGGGCGCN